MWDLEDIQRRIWKVLRVESQVVKLTLQPFTENLPTLCDTRSQSLMSIAVREAGWKS